MSGAKGGREWGVTANEYKLSFWSNANVLKPDRGGDYTTSQMYRMSPPNCIPQNGSSYVNFTSITHTEMGRASALTPLKGTLPGLLGKETG